MSLRLIKPKHFRPVGLSALGIGIALALYLYFSAISQTWLDFTSGLLIGVGVGLVVGSFGDWFGKTE